MPSYDAYMENMGKHGIDDHVSLDRTLNFKLSPDRRPLIDEFKLGVESMEKIEDILDKSNGKKQLLKTLSENDDTFSIKHYSGTSDQDWVINEFRK